MPASAAAANEQPATRFAKDQLKSVIERIEKLGVRCITGDFASEENVVRHAANRVTGALLALGHSKPKRD